MERRLQIFLKVRRKKVKSCKKTAKSELKKAESSITLNDLISRGFVTLANDIKINILGTL